MFPPALGAEICVAGTQTDEWAGPCSKMNRDASASKGLAQRLRAQIRLGFGLWPTVFGVGLIIRVVKDLSFRVWNCRAVGIQKPSTPGATLPDRFC